MYKTIAATILGLLLTNSIFVYLDIEVRNAINKGYGIEHAYGFKEATLQKMVEKGIYVVLLMVPPIPLDGTLSFKTHSVRKRIWKTMPRAGRSG